MDDEDLRCRHLAVTPTGFCLDCHSWLEMALSDEEIARLSVYQKP
jgi:hypothetical protein